MTTSTDPLAAVFGSGAPVWEELARTQPEFVDAYAAYARAAQERPAVPADKRALLQLAAECTVTVLDARTTEDRMRAALDAGATSAEVLHVLMLVSFCSVHTITSGLVATLSGLSAGTLEVSAERADEAAGLRERFMGGRAYWAAFDAGFPGFHEALSVHAPDLFEAYHRLGRSMWTEAGLEPRWCELVFVAMDLSTTHLYLEGARLHAANAVHYGASLDEVVATVTIAAAQGARTVELGVPILGRLLAERALS